MPITKEDGDRTADDSLNLLNFIGERSRPSFPGEMQDRPPILGKGEPPAELIRLAQTREYYIRTTSPDSEPEVKLERVRDADDRVWRVQIPDASFDALPGRTALRERPEKIVREIDRNISFTGYRPPWAHSFHAPRIAADWIERPMRRFNGRTVQPLYVFGPDDRVAYNDSTWPWGLVGKLSNSDGKVGSAALIGQRIIATAGHMLPWNSIAQGSWWMKFVPAYFNGSSLFGAGVQSYVSDCLGYNTSGDVTGYDFAVCRLYTSLGHSLGYFGYNGYDDDWEDEPYWTVLGYPTSVASGQKPSFQTSIAVVDDDGDSNGGLEIESYADITGGNSGGPFLSWWNGGTDPRLIGVISGQEEEYSFPFSTEKVNVAAGGSGFTNLMAWGRTGRSKASYMLCLIDN
jgi:V8-like Glu-specific endopeptidase